MELHTTRHVCYAYTALHRALGTLSPPSSLSLSLGLLNQLGVVTLSSRNHLNSFLRTCTHTEKKDTHTTHMLQKQESL